MKNYYEVLGLSKTATPEEIKKSYKKLARENHPDSNSGNVERFKEIQEAYEVLKDPTKRAHYDSGGSFNMQFRTRGPAGFNPMGAGFSFQDAMEGFFSGSNFRGSNINVRLEIEFEESFSGCKKPIKVKKRKICSTCRGKGFASFDHCNNCAGSGFSTVNDGPFQIRMPCQSCGGTGRINVQKCETCSGAGYESDTNIDMEIEIEVPAGVDNGMQMRMTGQGEASLKGGQPGDLIVSLVVKSHPLFTRDGFNVCLDMPVSYTQLVLGDEIKVPTLTEELAIIEIPAGTQTGTKFKLKGRGFISGDLIVTVKVDIPSVLDDEYKTAMADLAELENKNVSSKRKDYLNKLGPK